jgi:segregation and condensation protein B
MQDASNNLLRGNDPANGNAEPENGLSLDRLNEAFAALLASGDDPYRAPPKLETPDSGGLSHAEAAVDETSGEDDDPCEITPRSILEAMLFVGRASGPLTSQEIAAPMRGVRPEEIDGLVAELNERYEANACPYYITSDGAGYRLTLREEYAPVREQMQGRLREARLSQAAIDTLAIVAYHQPATAGEVAKLRGKPSGALLAQLVRRQLLRIDHTDEPERRKEYTTTKGFLEFFGIESIEELPRPQDVERA